MIYLFEDRKGRKEQFLKQDIVSEKLKEAIFDYPEGMSISDYLSQTYSDAKAILFHKSYKIPSNNITIENIKAEFIRLKVPVVLFSGGLGNNYFESGGIISANINSGTMYGNLPEFVNEFEKSGQINIPLLIYGSKYALNEILYLQHLATALFSGKPESSILTKNEIDTINNFIQLAIRDESLSDGKNKLIKWLNSSDIKVAILKEQLNKFASKVYE